MQIKSNVLPELIRRLKLATRPASRCFLVALFIIGFTINYFDDLPLRTHPQYAANPDVKNHPPKPPIVFVPAVFAKSGRDHVVALSTPRGLFKSVNRSTSSGTLPSTFRRLSPRSWRN
jgi:hypothetical protein